MLRLCVAWTATVSLVTAPILASAQRANAPPRVAVVMAAASPPRLATFREGLRELGHAEGQNVLLEVHAWAGAAKDLDQLAAALVRGNPAVIVVESNPATAALKRATQAIPIVMAVVADPVGSGFVANLAHPGGNISGLSNTSEQLMGKRLELLKDLVPSMTRVGVLKNPANATHPQLLRETEAAARALGMTLLAVDFRGESDLPSSFAALAEGGVQAAVLLPQANVVALRERIVEAGALRRLPMIFHTPEPVEAGGLVAYGPSSTALWRRAAYYVDRILKGARPGDLPIEQPTHFDLVVNAKTANELGLTVPQTLRLRATKIIE